MKGRKPFYLLAWHLPARRTDVIRIRCKFPSINQQRWKIPINTFLNCVNEKSKSFDGRILKGNFIRSWLSLIECVKLQMGVFLWDISKCFKGNFNIFLFLCMNASENIHSLARSYTKNNSCKIFVRYAFFGEVFVRYTVFGRILARYKLPLQKILARLTFKKVQKLI